MDMSHHSFADKRQGSAVIVQTHTQVQSVSLWNVHQSYLQGGSKRRSLVPTPVLVQQGWDIP